MQEDIRLFFNSWNISQSELLIQKEQRQVSFLANGMRRPSCQESVSTSQSCLRSLQTVQVVFKAAPSRFCEKKNKAAASYSRVDTPTSASPQTIQFRINVQILSLSVWKCLQKRFPVCPTKLFLGILCGLKWKWLNPAEVFCLTPF